MASVPARAEVRVAVSRPARVQESDWASAPALVPGRVPVLARGSERVRVREPAPARASGSGREGARESEPAPVPVMVPERAPVLAPA